MTNEAYVAQVGADVKHSVSINHLENAEAQIQDKGDTPLDQQRPPDCNIQSESTLHPVLHLRGGSDDDDFDLGALKKKKRNKNAPADKAEPTAGNAKPVAENAVMPTGSNLDNDNDLDISKLKKKSRTDMGQSAAVVDSDDENLQLTKAKKKTTKKKKKTKKKVFDDDEDDGHATAAPADDNDGVEDDDRPYNYKELLDRLYSKILKDRPELQEKKRTKMKPPQVGPGGSRKTMFANFGETCSTMHREQEHCLAYVLAELGTSGSIDGQQRLILKGRFTAKGVENIVRRYISEYVTCKMCRSADTILTRDQATRLHFIECQSCASKRTVPPIKMGFQAQTGPRRAVN